MAPARHRRQLAAILSIDMRQYSWFMSLDESSTHEITKSGLRRFEKLLKQHAGQIIGHAGDGMITKLNSAIDAVELAVGFQEHMQADPLPISEVGLARFRIGIHVADVISDGGRIHGTGVNIAKRLESLADPGGILVSRSVYDQVKDKNKYELEYLGPLHLKNISQSTTAYRLFSKKNGTMLRPTVREAANPLPVPTRKSIAVLPFKDVSPNQDQVYFCSSLSDEVTSNLARFHDLFVISYRSSSIFKGLDVPAESIGRDLGVEYILQGSVNKSGNRLRVVNQLIETKLGSHVWSERFDSDITNIFDIQDHVTQMLCVRLAVQVEGNELARNRTKETQDLEAYGLILNAQESLFAYTKQGNQAARSLCERAISRDPEYARAYAALSRTHIYDWRYLWSDSPSDSFDKALEAAKTAVRLDEGDARGYAELGFVHLWSKEIEVAVDLYRRALLLNPNSADIMAELADALGYAGRLEEAESLIKSAMRLNPYYPDWYLWYLADIYYGMRRFRDVISSIAKMRDRREGYRLLAAAHAMLGEEEQARLFAGQVLLRQPNFSVTRWVEIQPEADTVSSQLLAEGLLKAGLPA
ncbi:adenylate/guanylate cyclase domain-containing protein [Mesorhizobium ventifaucium]|nr:adenylate/guanylate cyclase domain-containing protein [Mesorhizobium ventifaucium]